MNLYKECTAKPYFLVIDTTLTLDNPLRFRQNLLIMIINEKIRNEKLKYDNNREAANISVL